MQKRGILERLDAGEIVIGDGGFVFALEKRGYVRAGPWTPEVNVEYPGAGWSRICSTRNFKIPMWVGGWVDGREYICQRGRQNCDFNIIKLAG